MYDPKFEKAVQQKMEELEFRPSESVWVNIEKAVAGERRRRVIPYFWTWLAPALLLTGIVGAWYLGENLGEKAGKRAVVMTPAGQVAPAPAAQVGSAPAGQVSSAPAGHVVPAPAGPLASSAGTKASAPATAENRVADDRVADNTGVAAGGGNAQESAATPGIAPYLYSPDLDGRPLTPRVDAAKPGTHWNAGSLNSLSRPKRSWEAGFTAGAGIDHLNRLTAGQGNYLAASFSNSIYSLGGNGRIDNSVSDVRPDASFSAGVYLQRPISGRWTFNTGLDLHYFSSRISIGQQLNTFVPTSASLLAVPSAIAVAQAPVVYTVGNQHSYTNRYYMLQLPVGMQYRINQSRMLPLFLEGGFSVSRVMSADALFYNPSTGLYLKNENALNKTQFDLASALMVGLPFHGIRIMAGPQVQYGLTRLLNSQSLGDQHFFYTGLRIVVLPGRR